MGGWGRASPHPRAAGRAENPLLVLHRTRRALARQRPEAGFLVTEGAGRVLPHTPWAARRLRSPGLRLAGHLTARSALRCLDAAGTVSQAVGDRGVSQAHSLSPSQYPPRRKRDRTLLPGRLCLRQRPWRGGGGDGDAETRLAPGSGLRWGRGRGTCHPLSQPWGAGHRLTSRPFLPQEQ